MPETGKKAILVVSFGTSYEETRVKNIDAIENDIREAYPDYRHYRAWTSRMIKAKLKKRDNIIVPNVKEAMEEMLADGITDVIVQPTHVINGIENDRMKEDALAFSDVFHSIAFGTPLLTSDEDHEKIINAVADGFPELGTDEALVLMGHGTKHYANSVYAALNFRFQDEGYPNIFLGTVEAYPKMDALVRAVGREAPEKVIIAPFMIVAGDHATNDLAGDGEDSWKNQFSKAGYQVECVIKGLGEYPAIRRVFVDHVSDAIASAGQ